MRFLYLFFLLAFSSIGIAQNQINWDQSDYQTLIQKSKAENKPIFLMLYASWCPHCAKMKTEVLQDSQVIRFLNQNYICAWQDIDEKEGMAMNTKLKVTSLPTFIFMDSNEIELYRLKGEYKTPEFIAEIQNSLNPKQQLPYLEKEFLSEPSNTQKWLNYMNVLKKGRERPYLSEKVSPYFVTQTDAQLISTVNWQIISNCVTDINSREFQLVLHHQKEFEAVSSPLRVERKINNIVTELLKPLAETKDTVAYYQQRKIAQTIQNQKVDSLIFRYDLMLAERTENWVAYKKITLESTEKQVWNDAAFLKEISQNYLKHISDSASLKSAIKWTNRSLAITNSYDGTLLLAYLYLKINDRKLAVSAAQNAKAICTAYGFNSKEVDTLLVKLEIKN
jgi:thioredoxin-related protein